MPPDRVGGPEAGEPAPDFHLQSLDGRAWTLSEAVRKKPVALILGSYSCPAFRGWAGSWERLRDRYEDEVEFLILYTIEAHPSGSASPYRDGKEWLTSFNRRADIRIAQPESSAERAQVAATCRDALALETSILLDTMDNRVWEAYGKAPNAAYLIGTDGRVVLRQGWFHEPSFGRSVAKLLDEGRRID